jgi:alkylhydroperoxidase family enzyme
MKRLLEDMKARTPRIPLPEPTDEEKSQIEDRSRGYESRLRTLYLPEGDSRGGLSFSSGPGQPQRTPRPGDRRPQDPPDPAITLDYRFKTSLFWIASRGNNCQYCLGHQESKLLSAGMVEDEIAALDSDWSRFTPAEQAAFSLARRLTLEPHRLSDADIDSVRKHYTDLQILEMVLSVAGNNSINRWKEGTGVPQSTGGGGFGRRSDTTATAEREEHSYLTPTSKEFEAKPSVVAAFVAKTDSSPSLCETICARPPLESRAETEKMLAAAERRAPRLPIVDEAQARQLLGDAAPDATLPNWARLLANFPIAGKRSVAGIRIADEKGELSPLLKAQTSWVIARQDRAWYALGQAKRRLKDLGQTDDQIYALDADWQQLSKSDQALLTVARKLAASPVVLTDEDVAAAVQHAGPRDTVQLISYTTNRASFNRFTEAAGLPIEN